MLHHLISKVSRRVFSSAGPIFRDDSNAYSVITKQYCSTIISHAKRSWEQSKNSSCQQFLEIWVSVVLQEFEFCNWFHTLEAEDFGVNYPEELADIWDAMPHMLFTGLEDSKARGTQAAPYFTATYYKEIADTKDMVLIRGDVVFTSKLSDEEAKWLLETAQTFYLNDGRYKLVEHFNKETREFEFKDVLKALDMPIL